MVKISEEHHATKNGKLKRNPYKNGGTEYLSVQRVPWETDEVSVSEREYWKGSGMVGKIKDWLVYAKSKGYLGLRVFEIDGKIRYEYA